MTNPHVSGLEGLERVMLTVKPKEISRYVSSEGVVNYVVSCDKYSELKLEFYYVSNGLFTVHVQL